MSDPVCKPYTITIEVGSDGGTAIDWNGDADDLTVAEVLREVADAVEESAL